MKRKLLTRKNKALGWLTAAMLLAVLLWLLFPFYLTAEAAHHQAVANQLIRPTEIVHEENFFGGDRLILAVNEDVVCVSTPEPRRWLGWYAPYLVELAEREDDRPFAAGYFTRGDPENDAPGYHIYFQVYGVVQDETVTEIGIAYESSVPRYTRTVRLTESDWLVSPSGERTFLWKTGPENGYFSTACRITGYRADGSATETYQLLGRPGWE